MYRHEFTIFQRTYLGLFVVGESDLLIVIWGLFCLRTRFLFFKNRGLISFKTTWYDLWFIVINILIGNIYIAILTYLPILKITRQELLLVKIIFAFSMKKISLKHSYILVSISKSKLSLAPFQIVIVTSFINISGKIFINTFAMF